VCIDYIASGADTPSNSKPLRKTCCTLIESNKRACDKGIFVSSTNLTPSCYTIHEITQLSLSDSYQFDVVHSICSTNQNFRISCNLARISVSAQS
jgi:hypothetical protein